MTPLTVGSLFAGIGGIDLGLERTGGFETVWQVESDPYASRVLANHWPRARRWGDVKTFIPDTASERRGAWGEGRTLARRQRRAGSAFAASWRCDVVAAGFPCQDVSFAGPGGGLAGKRSGLWWEAARVVRTIRPRYVLLENVAALLVRGLDAVLGTLAALGYDSEWHCIQAADVGAPHIRDRVFVLAWLADAERGEGGERRDAPLVVGRPDDAEQAGVGRRGTDVADADGERQQQPQRGVADVRRRLGDFREEVGSRQWGRDPAEGSEPRMGRVVDGLPRRMDRLRCLGNAVVPQVAEFVGRRLLEIHRGLIDAKEADYA